MGGRKRRGPAPLTIVKWNLAINVASVLAWTAMLWVARQAGLINRVEFVSYLSIIALIQAALAGVAAAYGALRAERGPGPAEVLRALQAAGRGEDPAELMCGLYADAA